MNIENAKQALEWFSELPDERHDQEAYFSHCDYWCSDYDGIVPDDAKMCFGGMIIHRARLHIDHSDFRWAGPCFTVAKWLGITGDHCNVITSARTREDVISRVKHCMEQSK